MNRTFVSICLFVLCWASVLSAPDKKCNKSLFDTHAANVFAQFGLDELNFPETTSQLGKYCKQTKASNDFAKTYGETCLKGTSQTLMSLAAYNFNLVNKPYCAKKAKKKEDFIRWAQCGNKAKVNTKKCWSSMITDMAMTDKVKNSKSRIPLICCTYYEWIRCTVKAMSDMGAAVCPKDSVQGYDDHIKKASVDSMNLICSKYEDDPKKCAAFRKELPDGPRPKKVHKTPMLYIFDVFDKL